jgi:hypothetical protein
MEHAFFQKLPLASTDALIQRKHLVDNSQKTQDSEGKVIKINQNAIGQYVFPLLSMIYFQKY